MLSNVTFGQYYPVSSPVHRMDPRVKILLSILFIVAVFFVKTYSGYGVLFVLLLMSIIVARVKITAILKSIKALIFLIVFTAILNLLFTKTGNIVWEWWIIKITDDGIRLTIMMALRLLFLIMSTSILTLTTTPIELTDGIESLLTPLKLIRFPVHDLAIIMSIALRFVPTLMEETDKIIMAQKSRGADFESGNIFKRIRALVPVIIPLFVSAFRRAEELSYAMDARCYNASKKRTRYRKMSIHFRDIAASFIYIAFFVGVLTLSYQWFNVNSVWWLVA